MARDRRSNAARLAERVSNLASVLSQVGDDATSAFGTLTVDELNWMPGPARWSVAQCFDHLITTHSKFFPTLARLAAGDVRMSWWERHSPFSRFLGGFFVSSLDPANPTKRPTTSNAMPSSTAIGADIIQRFAAHQAEMIVHVRRLPPGLDPDLIITSPLLAIVTYRLDDVLVFLGLHCRRHFHQAQRVTASEGFPAVGSR
jgi:hypothetical protein